MANDLLNRVRPALAQHRADRLDAAAPSALLVLGGPACYPTSVQSSRQRFPDGVVLLVMGIAGSGKTTIGRGLAAAIDARFIDADAYHSAANIEKMSRGEGLTDADRAPWLASLRQVIEEVLAEHGRAVLACSALKQSYRDVLRADARRVPVVFLTGSRELIAQRLNARRGHYASASLLDSQLATLEPPDDAIVVDVAPSPDELVRGIVDRLAASRG